MIPNLQARRVLLLQGPMGPFFRRLADELLQQDVEEVWKVNFNAGDACFFRGANAIAYRGRPESWPDFLRQLLRGRDIDAVIVFGDGRLVHRQAAEVCTDMRVAFYVLEEGYLRPNYVTLERGGVNGFSSMPRDASFYLTHAADLPALPQPAAPQNAFRYTGWYSTLYSLALTFGKLAYPRYRHHRPLNAFAEAYRWVLSGIRKLRYARLERHWLPLFTGEWSGKYFLVVLQVHCDYQLQHSGFESVEQFIEHVVDSFARHAPADNRLVLKHHPLDRAYRDYTRLLRRVAKARGLEDRLAYVHDLHLPTMLKHARGSVMINSTVGLSSIHHKTPVKILGDAVYNFDGLTSQQPLERFWQDPGEVDQRVYRAYRRWLLHHNQSNGNFYRRLPETENPTGIVWYPLRALAPTADTRAGTDSNQEAKTE